MEDISVREAGRRGGLKTLERHGVEHFNRIRKLPRSKKDKGKGAKNARE